MKLGSHNSMSYLTPTKWWMRLFHFVARCQSKSIEEQYEKYGIRMFDLRIKYDKHLVPHFAHGSVVFEGNIEETLKYLNSKGDCISRIILEYNKDPKSEHIEEQFIDDVLTWMIRYPNIKFFEGRRKWNWRKLIHFEYEPDYYQAVSSMTGNKLDDWYPYLYAKTFNKNNIEQGTSHEWMLIDFVEIR